MRKLGFRRWLIVTGLTNLVLLLTFLLYELSDLVISYAAMQRFSAIGRVGYLATALTFCSALWVQRPLLARIIIALAGSLSVYAIFVFAAFCVIAGRAQLGLPI